MNVEAAMVARVVGVRCSSPLSRPLLLPLLALQCSSESRYTNQPPGCGWKES